MIIKLIISGFFIFLIRRMVVYTTQVIRARFIANTKQEIKHNMFISLMSLDTSNISNVSSSGEYISMFTNDLTILEGRFYNQLFGLFSAIFSILILGASFLTLNKTLAAFILGFGLLTMLIPVIFSRNLNEKNLEYSEKISRFTQKLKEYLAAYPTIKNYSIERLIIKNYSVENKNAENAKFEADASLTLANTVGQLAAWFIQFIGVGIGLIMVMRGDFKLGTVVAVQTFANDLGLPMQNLINHINSIRSVKNVVKKLIQNTQKIEEIYEGDDCKDKPSYLNTKKMTDVNLVFDDVCLKIGDKTIIDHFSFIFENNKKYLIIGLNGSGKSSIFKTLKKWHRDYQGSIMINNTDIKNLQNHDISSIVSYLSEQVSLFSGTVKENILLFRDIEKEQYEKVIQDAQIHINLAREINDEGRNISSGEQRRIEIARSLLHSVKVLVFDEVVSTLDIETAYEVEKLALELKEKTLIFISHNFSGKLISNYDQILVVDKGRLIAHGHYEDLIQESDYFRKICEIKFGQDFI